MANLENLKSVNGLGHPHFEMKLCYESDVSYTTVE